MNKFYIGRHLTHPQHGDCTVTFVGDDYVGIELSDGQQGLIKKEAFFGIQPGEECSESPNIRPSTWPESTFVQENTDNLHYPGTHWEAFFDDAQTVVEKVSEIFKTAESWIGGVNRQPPRDLPDNWTSGSVLAWPNHRQGVMLTISIGEENLLRNLFPFITNGGQHTIIIDSIHVWEAVLTRKLMLI